MGPTPLASGGAKDVYVQQYTTSGLLESIMDFAADTSGSLTPKATLLLPANAEFFSMAIDSAGELYVGVLATDTSLDEVLVYAPGATGQATPVRTINLLSPGFPFVPLDLTVSPSGKLFVVGPEEIGTFPADASGDTSPSNVLSVGTSVDPVGIAADAAGNVYIANYIVGNNSSGQILVYAAGASGNALPIVTIDTPGIPYGVTLDASGNFYTSANVVTLDSSGEITASINQVVEYPALSSSAVNPVKTIAGSATGLTFATGPQIDEAGNLYLFTTITSGSGSAEVYTPEIVGFAPTASGNVKPGLTFTSSSWTYSGDHIAVH